jgi:hypothetical protein
MSNRQFIQKDNVDMLWEVISDEEIFKFLSRDLQTKIYELFLNNIQGFFDNELLKTNSLVDMNKKYILLILNHIKKNYNVQPSKITIFSEPVKESITYEEIHNERKTQFEKDFSKRQEEFKDFMSVKAPPVPEFSDKDRDTPIKEMDKILKEMQAQRNYEIEQINRNYNNSNDTTNLDNWLKPQETSLKSEKFMPNKELNQGTKNQLHTEQQSQNYSRFKFLNELESDISPKDKKNVSFSNIEEIKTYNDDNDYDDEDDNIFSKLKKVKNKQNENITLEIHEPTLIENTLRDVDRISNLEREVKNINNKMDKILELLSKK